MPSKIQEPYIGQLCERCNFGKYEDEGQEWFVKCNECDAIHFCYNPLPHQTAFHADPAKIKAFFGG